MTRLARSLDLILAQPVLNLRDHVALAATSRFLRSCYYTVPTSGQAPFSSLWKALILLRPHPNSGIDQLGSHGHPTSTHHALIKQIASNENRVDPAEMQVVWPAMLEVTSPASGRLKVLDVKPELRGRAIRSGEWDEAVGLLLSCVSTSSIRA